VLPVNVLAVLTAVPELATNPEAPVPVVAGWTTGVAPNRPTKAADPLLWTWTPSRLPAFELV